MFVILFTKCKLTFCVYMPLLYIVGIKRFPIIEPFYDSLILKKNLQLQTYFLSRLFFVWLSNIDIKSISLWTLCDPVLPNEVWAEYDRCYFILFLIGLFGA